MSGGGDAKAAWVEQVLGVTVPRAAGQNPVSVTGAVTARWRAAREAWDAASDTVDGQIAALQAALRKSGDDTLEEIAEFGLNAVTGNHRVPLKAALFELGAAEPAALRKFGPKALGIIDDFRSYLESSEAVEVCDANPFGTPVSIRATLGSALAQMADALRDGLAK